MGKFVKGPVNSSFLVFLSVFLCHFLLKPLNLDWWGMGWWIWEFEVFFLLSYLYCGSLVFTQAFSVPGVLEYFLYIFFFCSALFSFMGFVLKMVFELIWAVIGQFIWIHLKKGHRGNWRCGFHGSGHNVIWDSIRLRIVCLFAWFALLVHFLWSHVVEEA